MPRKKKGQGLFRRNKEEEGTSPLKKTHEKTTFSVEKQKNPTLSTIEKEGARTFSMKTESYFSAERNKKGQGFF